MALIEEMMNADKEAETHFLLFSWDWEYCTHLLDIQEQFLVNCNDSHMLVSSASMPRVCQVPLCISEVSFPCSAFRLMPETGRSQGSISSSSSKCGGPGWTATLQGVLLGTPHYQDTRPSPSSPGHSWLGPPSLFFVSFLNNCAF